MVLAFYTLAWTGRSRHWPSGSMVSQKARWVNSVCLLTGAHHADYASSLLLLCKPPQSLKQWQKLFCWWICNSGSCEQDNLSLFHSLQVRGWNYLKAYSLHAWLSKLPLSRDLPWSCGYNTSTWPSHVVAWLPSSVVSGFQGRVQMESQTEAMSQHHLRCVLCEELPLRPTHIQMEGSLTHLFMGDMPKNLWTCTKTILPPMKNFVESWTWIWWNL